MHRTALDEFINWKNRENRKPLVVYGARQVGKTWLMEEFGRTNYRETAYIMMAENPRMTGLFDGNSNASSIIRGLEAEAGFSFDPQNTLIVLDEIQEVPKAISALKFIYEQAPEYHVIAAGSLLGVAHHSGVSFPVGKVNSLTVHPMTFYEFVRAVKSENFAGMLINRDHELLEAFHDELNNLLKQYFIIGGMPEVVAGFAANGDYFEARTVQKQIIGDYERDFSKHAPVGIVPRIQMVWNSVASQLAKENKKFLYSALKTGARAKDFELAIQWLTDAGLAQKVQRVKSGRSPLKHYEDLNAFKLFLVDIGLLSAMSNLEPRIVLEQSNVFTEYKGAMTEQFVAEQLLAKGEPVYYFTSDNAKVEIDFMIEVDGMTVPIEVKSAGNLHSRSLSNFIARNSIERAIKFSLRAENPGGTIHNAPLYLAEFAPLLMKRAVAENEKAKLQH